jgi:hypothetical protein
MDVNEVEKDYEVYKHLLDLWAKENPIKTNKLQVLLVVNGLLLTAVNMGGGFKAGSWPIYLGGAVLCLVWVLSIGRTSLFQAAWQAKIVELAQKYPDDRRFHILSTKDAMKKLPKSLRFVGGVSSKYYLIGAPILFGIGWLCVFLYFLLTGL